MQAQVQALEKGTFPFLCLCLCLHCYVVGVNWSNTSTLVQALEKGTFPFLCLCLCLCLHNCYVVSVITGTRQAQEKRKYFWSVDKQTNASSLIEEKHCTCVQYVRCLRQETATNLAFLSRWTLLCTLTKFPLPMTAPTCTFRCSFLPLSLHLLPLFLPCHPIFPPPLSHHSASFQPSLSILYSSSPSPPSFVHSPFLTPP